MNNFNLCKIEIFDSFIFFNYTNEGMEKRISLSFSIDNNKEKLQIHFTEDNSFLQFFRFNNLLIEDFLIKLINQKMIENIIITEEDCIPF